MADAHTARKLARSAARPGRASRSLTRLPGRAARPVLLLCVVSSAIACGSAAPAAAPAAARQPAAGLVLPAAVRSAGLTVLTDPVVPPISSYAVGSRTIVGTDPDILRALAKVLGVRVTFTAIGQFEGLLTGVQSGRGDVAAGGITDTALREKTVWFVDDFRLGELFLYKRGHAPPGISPAPLSICGDTVAYTNGTVSAAAVPALSRQCTAAGKPAIKAVGFAGVSATVLAVEAGRVQVALYDDFGFPALDKANGGNLQAIRITPYPDQYWGFAVSKADKPLAEALLAALKAITADGTYRKILDRYGVSEYALVSPGIDLQASRPQG